MINNPQKFAYRWSAGIRRKFDHRLFSVWTPNKRKSGHQTGIFCGTRTDESKKEKHAKNY
jgi:hypothetical protein